MGAHPATTPNGPRVGGRLVVIGANVAGLRAAEAARAGGWTGSIALVGDEAIIPYGRPQLSKAMLEVGADSLPQPFRPRSELMDDLCLDLLLGRRAVALDPDRRMVTFDDGSGLAYDRLVIATGATPLPLPGSDGVRGVYGVRRPADAVAVREALDRVARTVVVGAGFIGAEVASTARARGMPITIVEQAPLPLMRSLGAEPGEICADLHRGAGVDLRLGVGVDGLTTDGDAVTGVSLSDGSWLPAELVVVGIGSRPSTEWLRSSGIDLHPRDGGVLCNGDLQTSLPDVWAAGDVAHFPNPLFFSETMRPEHWTNAAESGARAGLAAAGAAPATGFETVPYFWSDWYGHRLQFVGISVADEVRVVGPAGPGCLVLYGREGRLVGTLGIDRPGDIMKFRRRIVKRVSWDDAAMFAHDLVGTPSGPGPGSLSGTV